MNFVELGTRTRTIKCCYVKCGCIIRKLRSIPRSGAHSDKIAAAVATLLLLDKGHSSSRGSLLIGQNECSWYNNDSNKRVTNGPWTTRVTGSLILRLLSLSPPSKLTRRRISSRYFLSARFHPLFALRGNPPLALDLNGNVSPEYFTSQSRHSRCPCQHSSPCISHPRIPHRA